MFLIVGLEVKKSKEYIDQLKDIQNKEIITLKDLYRIYKFRINGCEINNRQCAIFSQQFNFYILHQWLLTNSCIFDQLSLQYNRNIEYFKKDTLYFIEKATKLFFSKYESLPEKTIDSEEDSAVNINESINKLQFDIEQIKSILQLFVNINMLRKPFNSYTSKVSYNIVAIDQVKTDKSRYTYSRCKIGYLFCLDNETLTTKPIIFEELLQQYHQSRIQNQTETKDDEEKLNFQYTINLELYYNKSICDIFEKIFGFCQDFDYQNWFSSFTYFSNALDNHRKMKFDFQHRVDRLNQKIIDQNEQKNDDDDDIDKYQDKSQNNKKQKTAKSIVNYSMINIFKEIDKSLITDATTATTSPNAVVVENNNDTTTAIVSSSPFQNFKINTAEITEMGGYKSSFLTAVSTKKPITLFALLEKTIKTSKSPYEATLLYLNGRQSKNLVENNDSKDQFEEESEEEIFNDQHQLNIENNIDNHERNNEQQEEEQESTKLGGIRAKKRKLMHIKKIL